MAFQEYPCAKASKGTGVTGGPGVSITMTELPDSISWLQALTRVQMSWTMQDFKRKRKEKQKKLIQ